MLEFVTILLLLWSPFNIRETGAVFKQVYNDQASAVNIERAPAIAPTYPVGGPYAYPQQATQFQQQYNHNAHATNIGKRDAGFDQVFNDRSSAVNIESAPAIAATYPVGGHYAYPQQATQFRQQYNHNAHATNIGKRDAIAQFLQNNHGGSTSYNYDCKHGGCGNNLYNQKYFAGSQGINVDYGKK